LKNWKKYVENTINTKHIIRPKYHQRLIIVGSIRNTLTTYYIKVPELHKKID